MLRCSRLRVVREEVYLEARDDQIPCFRLYDSERLLCNSLESVEWAQPFVQVRMCESCGYSGCSCGEYVRVVRLGRHLLWCPVDPEEARERTGVETADLVVEHGMIALDAGAWDEVAAEFSQVPWAKDFSPARRRDLALAWLLHAPDALHRATLEHLERDVLPRILCSDGLAMEEAARLTAAVLRWVRSGANEPVGGELVLVRESGLTIETLYFDAPRGCDEWPAFALGAGVSLAFGRAWTIAPEMFPFTR